MRKTSKSSKSKFIRIVPKHGGAGMGTHKKLRYKFNNKPRANGEPRYFLQLTMGIETQEHLDVEKGDKIIVSYNPDNPCQIMLEKAEKDDLAYKLCVIGKSTSLALNILWEVCELPEEIVSKALREPEYDEADGCVIITIKTTFDD